MNRKWFIHCLSVVLFFIERSVIFGNHIVEQRNKQEKNMSEKLKTFVGQMCNEMSILPTMVHSCANDATIFPRFFFFVCSSSLLGLWLLFFMQEQLIRRAYIEK